MIKWHKITFESELLSRAINRAAKWRKENPKAFVLSSVHVFNPSGKSSVTYSYKNYGLIMCGD